ncbi:MAG TPA: GNAT family N-acetyltransferase [Oribacterium sp.]|nr:GNAT family N-acetyltransferase [Oribacterium sp.]HCS67726.1 GNAT family N-acetyltransferase [Oribacterium sp.]
MRQKSISMNEQDRWIPRVLSTRDEKTETRALYERIFTEDSPAFLDWYYEDRCRDNLILDLREGEEVVSMVHLNPFIMRTRAGARAKVYYIYAVATAPEARHQGCMATLLERSFRQMEEEDIPFCFLLPVDEAIYTPFDFHTVCNFQEKKNLDYQDVQKTYDVYIEENADVQRWAEAQARLEEAEQEENAAANDLPDHPVIMARILSLSAFLRFSGLPEGTDRTQAMRWLQEQRIYIAEEV